MCRSPRICCSGDQVRQLAGERGLDLAAVLTQRGFDVRQAERLVDLRLGLGGEQVAGGRLEQAVLVELQPLAHRHLADPDVVGLGAGEVDHRGAPGLEGHHAEVDLEPVPRQDRGLRVAASDHPVDHVVARERLHDRFVVRRGHQQVDVTDRLGHPSQRARIGHPAHAVDRLQALEEILRDLERRAHQHPAAGRAHALGALEHVLLGLGREPLQRAQLPRLCRGDQRRHRVDGELLVDHHRLLGTEAGDGGHLAHARRHLGSELLELGERPGVEVLRDLGGDGLADAGDRQDAGSVETAQVVGIAAHRPRGLLIRTRLERIVRDDRQQVGVFEEHALDVVVRARHAMPQARPKRYRSRAFWVCRRFSASSQTAAWGPSITSAAISWPRWAGRQWSTTTSSEARSTSLPSSW